MEIKPSLRECEILFGIPNAVKEDIYRIQVDIAKNNWIGFKQFLEIFRATRWMINAN